MIPEKKDTLLETITYPPTKTQHFCIDDFPSFSRFGVGCHVILPFPGNGYSSRQLIQIPFVRYLDLGSNLIYAPGMEVASGKSGNREGSFFSF